MHRIFFRHSHGGASAELVAQIEVEMPKGQKEQKQR